MVPKVSSTDLRFPWVFHGIRWNVSIFQHPTGCTSHHAGLWMENPPLFIYKDIRWKVGFLSPFWVMWNYQRGVVLDSQLTSLELDSTPIIPKLFCRILHLHLERGQATPGNPRIPVTTRILTYLGGNPKLNLYLRLLLGGGFRSKVWSISGTWAWVRSL